jgi:hypothetical protein
VNLSHCRFHVVAAILTVLSLHTGSAQVPANTFLPICLGDASSWIVVQQNLQRKQYYPVSVQTRTIERDTVIGGSRYFAGLFPEECLLPVGWMRSDAAGLFLRTGDSDSLVIPAWSERLTPLLGGVVIDTHAVQTLSGPARAYRVTRREGNVDLSWVWVSGIGLWEFVKTEDSRMRWIYSYISGQRCGTGPATDPVALEVPLRTGDVLVHHRSISSTQREEFQIQGSRMTGIGTHWIGSPGPTILQTRNTYFTASVSARGMVEYTAGGISKIEYYPAFIPATDTVLIDRIPRRVVARFDTVVFSESVRAFTLEWIDRGSLQRMTVADRFGVVYEERSGTTASLHSAVVDGRKWNRSTDRRRYLPVCKGSVLEYAARNKKVSTVARGVLNRDTLINGREYIYLDIPGIRVDSSVLIKHKLNGWMREEDDGLYGVNDSLILPFTADLGDATPTGIVTELRTRFIHGQERVMMVVNDYNHHFIRNDTLVEGIGLLGSYEDLYIPGESGFTENWNFIGGVICGEVIGATLGSDDAALIPSGIELSFYPNPLRAGQGTALLDVRSQSFRHGRIAVVDVLGRVWFSGDIELHPGQNSITLPVSSLGPGSYVVSLTVGDENATTTLMVR